MSAQEQNQNDSLSDDVIIEITKMHKWYGEFHVLRDIDLAVKRNEPSLPNSDIANP